MSWLKFKAHIGLGDEQGSNKHKLNQGALLSESLIRGGNPMNFEEDIKSVTYLKSRSAELLNQVNETHRPVVITQKGKAKVVVQDITSYEMTRNALLLLKLIAQGEEDVRQGRTVDQSEVMSRMKAKLEVLRNQHEWCGGGEGYWRSGPIFL